MYHHVIFPLNPTVHQAFLCQPRLRGTDYEALCSLAMRLQCNGWTNYSKPLQAGLGGAWRRFPKTLGTPSHHPKWQKSAKGKSNVNGKTNVLRNPFSRMRSKGSRFTLGVSGLRVCSLDVAFTSATVRTNSVWPCLWEVLQRWSFLEVSDVWLLRFAWQAWHFVKFRRVLQRVESRCAWQAQYFCDVFRRCVAVFVAGAALWTCPLSFFVADAAL